MVLGDLCPPRPALALLAGFFGSQPQTRLQLLFETVSGPLERLLDGEADLILHRVDKSDPRLEWLDLCRVGLVPVIAPGLLGVPPPRPVRPEQLRPFAQCVMRDSARHSPPTDYFMLAGARQCSVPDQRTKKEVILQGLGWGHLPDFLVDEELADGRLNLSLAAFRIDLENNPQEDPDHPGPPNNPFYISGGKVRSQGFELGESRHEVGIGHRYVNEASHELRYWTRADSGQLPSTGSRNDRDTRGSTEANAFYIDDRIDIGNWTITPGIRYEKIDSEQKNLLKNSKDSGRYNASLPALNVIYHLTPSWNLYANTEGSFGTVQYSQMGKAVRSGDIEPEKARTWELGSRYDDGILRAELGAFLINFDNQYESNQQTDSVTARGKTRHKGIEAAIAYDLADLDPLLSGFDVYASYAYVDASIREDGPNKGNQVPFSSKHKGTLGANYRTGAWSYNLDGSFQTSQYADNANTESESADGSTGRIAGWMVWSARGTYDFGPQLNDLKLGLGVKNLFDRRYYTRSFDDNNKGLYVGQPRTLYVQASVGF